MYYVQNADGSRYGPVPQDTLEQWNREGRIAGDARFLDAVTEQPVERERLFPPGAPPQAGAPPLYPTAPQGQAYAQQQPRLHDVPQRPGGTGQLPQGYATPPQPYLTGAPGVYGQGNPQHNPVYAALWCLLCVTAGYIYNKQIVKGVVLTLVTLGIGLVTGGIAGWGILAVAMVDCYKIGERIKNGETVGDWQFF